jgi:hypothetical protein
MAAGALDDQAEIAGAAHGGAGAGAEQEYQQARQQKLK